MKIGVAQTKPVKGDIQHNLADHKKWIYQAASHGAHLIIFPELSLTGYEPTLAKELATYVDDSRLDELQQISDTKHITIGAGMPIRQQADAGITISMLIFQPFQPREVYSKQYLHADEIPFFVQAEPTSISMLKRDRIAMAICYEISVPEHAQHAFDSGAQTYIASVAKTVSGMEKAVKDLPEMARKYAMSVLLANCVGHCDDFDCGGRSSVWNNKGELLAQLNATEEGLLIFDSEAQEIIVQ
jgi:predicted amidohydrolase